MVADPKILVQSKCKVVILINSEEKSEDEEVSSQKSEAILLFLWTRNCGESPKSLPKNLPEAW